MKIFIIRNDHIGDLVYSTPIFREIKKSIPVCEITALVSHSNRPIIEKNPHVDRIWEIDTPKYSLKSILSYLKMSWKIRKERFDVGIDLRGSVQNSFFLLWLAGIKNKISHTEWHPVIKNFLDKALVFDKKRHIFEDNAEILNALGVKQRDAWPEIVTNWKDNEEVDAYLKENKIKKFICICPCVDLPHKQWNLDNFKNLASVFNKHRGYKVILIGTNKDTEAITNLSHAIWNSVVLLNYDVRKLVLLFKKSKLVIAHDGGPMHSAWLTGSKVITLYPAEVADKFIPLKNCKIFKSNSVMNMNSISFEDVKNAVEERL